MTVHAEKTFLKDVDKIKDKRLLSDVQKIIFILHEINSISEFQS